MYTIDSGSFPLTCHPQTPSQSIREIEAVVEEANSGSLMLTFCLAGDISGLSIPESRSPRRAENLWRHTCFEAFVMKNEGPEYREFNFSPSGEWAVYDFHGYREGSALMTELYPVIKVHMTMDRLELVAEIDQGLLPHDNSLKLGLSAVVENVAGIKSYWALRHPPGKPDFHHSDAFVIQMRNL